MSNPDNADVIQGRLGWEDGDISEADPEELEPHPKNGEIYGDTESAGDLNETFINSVREKGVLEPLVITNGKQIISGHRRWLAAKATDTDRVPVRKSEFDSDLAEREALIEFNRQREKTPGQIVNEFEEMLAIEEDRAKERKIANLKQGDEQPERENFHTRDEGRATERAAEKVNADVSGRTLQKGKTVKDKAESDDEPEEVREAAREAWDGLQSGKESFNGAYQEVKQAERELEEERQRESLKQQRQQSYENADKTAELHEGDFAEVADDLGPESIDAIVTDPPYDEGALPVWSKLSEVGARVLKPGGFLIAYSGKAHLPGVLERLGEELDYHWQGIVRHAGPGAKIFSRKLRTGYKPILVYVKPPADPQEDFISDVIEGAGREKDDHEWQQAEAEAAELIERFTATNDRILDPMCGSGTVGVAADRLNRRCVLIDQDPDAVETAREKVIE